jgi:hypothetical protein
MGPMGPQGPQGPRGEDFPCIQNVLTKLKIDGVCFTSNLNFVEIEFDFDLTNPAVSCANPLIFVDAMLYDQDSPYKPYVGTWSSVANAIKPFSELGNLANVQQHNRIRVPLAVSAELMYEDAEGCHKTKSGFVCVEVHCPASCQTYKMCVADQKIPGRLDP